jgi:hypothetical protein
MNKLVNWKRHLLLGPEKKNFDFLRQANFKLFSEITGNPIKAISLSTWFLLRAAIVILGPVAKGPSYATGCRHMRLHCILSQLS